jgi:hypothetical protein
MISIGGGKYLRIVSSKTLQISSAVPGSTKSFSRLGNSLAPPLPWRRRGRRASMNESLEANAVALHSVAKVLHSQYRATVAAYPANKRQTKIPVTALSRSATHNVLRYSTSARRSSGVNRRPMTPSSFSLLNSWPVLRFPRIVVFNSNPPANSSWR